MLAASNATATALTPNRSDQSLQKMEIEVDDAQYALVETRPTPELQSPAQTKKRIVKSNRRKVNAVVFLTEKIGPEVLPYLLQNHDLNLKVISESSKEDFRAYMDPSTSLDNIQWIENTPQDPYRNQVKMQGHQLARWADLLFIVMDASMTSLMLSGYTTDIILHVLRCWDTSKRIVMLPEMSRDQWKHPLWKKQLSKMERKWDWVHVLPPALWDFVDDTAIRDPRSHEEPEIMWMWEGPEEIIEAIHSEVQTVLRTSRLSMSSSSHHLSPQQSSSSKPRLPLEIWTNILDHLGDWELATALGIYTHIPTPYEWQPHVPGKGRPRSLEYTILTQPLSSLRTFFTSPVSQYQQKPTTLSALATKLIFKFSLTSLLTYLALHQKDIFWTSFGLNLIPHKASVIYNSPAILQWWLTCPAVIKKEYGPEPLDGASRAGFVEVLDWWLGSGLKLSYSEKALEYASAKGHVEVLEWWKRSSEARSRSGMASTDPDADLPLKVGKSILAAAQSGRAATIAWWDASGIPYGHESDVARLASTHGHVAVLELWHSLKGSKMIYDNQVLVGATKNGHAGVLEWWREACRRYGFVVEYKTCDIEEAMEDAVGGGGEGEVREWWGRNGLNLGVGTGEWMRVKTL